MREKTARLRAETNQWRTPERILAAVRALAGGEIPLDPATTADNPTHAHYWFDGSSPARDGLIQPWGPDHLAYVMPPYAGGTPYRSEYPLWTRKIRDEAVKFVPIVALLPVNAKFSTKTFQADVLANPALTAVCWLAGVVRFIGTNGKPCSTNTYASALFCFNIDGDLVRRHLSCLGAVCVLAE